MRTEWWIARRYFQGKGFLSFIKYMAISGIAAGTAGLLISLSIVHGFKSVITDKTLSYAPHITVTAPFEEGLDRADTLRNYLANRPEFDHVMPSLLSEVMIQGNGVITGGILHGLESDHLHPDFRQFLTDGAFSEDGVVLGAGIAELLDTGIGQTIYVFSFSGIPGFDHPPDIAQFEITGLYKTGIDRFDEGVLFASAAAVRNLTGRSSAFADQMDIRVSDLSESGLSGSDMEKQIESLSRNLRKDLSFPYVVESIFQRYRNLFEWIKLQEQTIPFVISIMVIIAAFNLIGTILMMVLERTQDIGILKTMGLNTESIRRIFLLEGLLVAAYGVIAGIGLSLIFMWSQLQFGWIRLSEENYYMNVAPIEPHLLDFVLVIGVTFILSLLASILPANVAAKSDPIRAISFQN